MRRKLIALKNIILFFSEKVRKCIRALEAAETDTEKFATLFLVPKLVKGTECNKDARLSLMKGIGYSFLARMLRSKDSPDGCPRLMFQSVALSVLSCFAQDEEIMTHPSVSFVKVGKSQNQIFLITILRKKTYNYNS